MKWMPIILLVMVGCKEIPEKIDLSLSAEEGKDITAIFEGCGKKTDGYMFCRLAEGSSADRNIIVHLPKVHCTRNNCVELQFIQRDGSLGYGVGIPEDEVSIPISKIIDSETVEKIHDGEYRVLARIWYIGSDEIERQVRFSGAIRLWVVKKEYQQLVCNDPERGWKKNIGGGCSAEYSTQMRTALCGGCK